MYHISLGAICILEQFVRHENAEFYERFIEDGASSVDFHAAISKGHKDKAHATHSVFKNKGPLGKALCSDSTFEFVFGHFHKDVDYHMFREYIAKHVKYHEGFEELHEIIPVAPIYPYLATKLSNSLESMIMIDWRVWLLVQVVLVGQAVMHYYMHVAVVELLPVNIAVGFSILAFQFVWTRRRAAYVVDEAHLVSTRAEGMTTEQLEAEESFETWLLWLQQLNFFFLCFSAARLMFSAFFWADYFRLSCCMLATFLVLYGVFMTIGALTVPMFIIMLAVPPHVTKYDREELKKLLREHSKSGVRRNDGSESCSVSLLVP